MLVEWFINLNLVSWLFDQGVFEKNGPKCPVTGLDMALSTISDRGIPHLYWRCTHRPNGDCNRKKKSVRDASMFSGLKSDLHKVLAVIWLFLHDVKLGSMQIMTGLSSGTIREILKLVYRLMNADIKDEDVSIGGVDENGKPIVVEVDESKFGKRKNHKGHPVEGVWVVGGVERTPERKVFLTTVEDRKKDTLHLILSTWIKAGSEIRTDCWKGYCGLSNVPDKQYTHKTVNHAKEFKTVDGVHTNTIEGKDKLEVKMWI